MTKWDERFAGAEYMFGTQPAQALTRHLDTLHKGGTTLAVADGEGRNSVYLAKQGFDVTAMDSSQIGLDKARKLAALHNVAPTFELADIYEYDCGGCLMLHGYTPRQIDYGTGGPSNVAHLYTPDMLVTYFGDMDIHLNQAYEAVLDEGDGHQGQSAVIDFIAYKR